MAEPDATLRHLLDLPDDALSSVLCACDLAALGAICSVSKQLKRIASTAAPWLALLFRDYDVVLPATTIFWRAKLCLRRILEASSVPLRCHGYLTDGGVDDEQEDPSE